MDGIVVVMDYSLHEREKLKHILKESGITDFLEIGSINQYAEASSFIQKALLVFIDIAFPYEAQGLGIISDIRKNPETAKTPIIITTKSDRLEYRETALKYNVKDYIIKPYDSKRLLSSVKNLIKLEHKFNYDTKGINSVEMNFEAFIDREMKIAERYNAPFTILLITPMPGEKRAAGNIPLPGELLGGLYPSNNADPHKILRASDAIFFNENGDVLVVLPFTSKSGIKTVSDRIGNTADHLLKDRGITCDDAYYRIGVTYPEDGGSFQALMEHASKRISDKQLLDKIASIPLDTRKFAKKRYNQFNRWF